MYKYMYTHIIVFIYIGERECCARGPKGRKLPLLSCGNQRIHRPTCQGSQGTKTSVAFGSSSATSCSTSCQGAAQVELHELRLYIDFCVRHGKLSSELIF